MITALVTIDNDYNTWTKNGHAFEDCIISTPPTWFPSYARQYFSDIIELPLLTDFSEISHRPNGRGVIHVDDYNNAIKIMQSKKDLNIEASYSLLSSLLPCIDEIRACCYQADRYWSKKTVSQRHKRVKALSKYQARMSKFGKLRAVS